jgi:hypothetical protein
MQDGNYQKACTATCSTILDVNKHVEKRECTFRKSHIKSPVYVAKWRHCTKSNRLSTTVGSILSPATQRSTDTEGGGTDLNATIWPRSTVYIGIANWEILGSAKDNGRGVDFALFHWLFSSCCSWWCLPSWLRETSKIGAPDDDSNPAK